MSPFPGRRASHFLLGQVALLAAALAQPPTRPEPPPYFAIRNARVVTVSGPVLEDANVVLAKGLISAVGKDVPIAPEAWVIDGTGLSVYPGLTDALTNLGLGGAPEAPAQPATTPEQMLQQARSQPPSRGPEDRPGTTPWENAADLLKISDRRMENWRKAGFTAAVTAPDKGIFPGQAAFIHLGDGEPRELVLKTPVALRMNLTPMGGLFGFPGSLMGVFAYSRQTYLDAAHYRQAWRAYEAGPRGQERPLYERPLEPISEAVANRWPILLPASLSREIDRALAFGEEMGLPTIVYGAHQAYERADALAAKRVPVLVSLKWPEKDRDADPDAEEALRVLRLRDRAPSTPAALHRAGVKFAFYSDGLANPQDILKNAKRTVEAGLPAEAAVRALTLSPAEIFGVADRLGSLEVGKIGNLVVTDGDLFADKTRVKMVFVDGRKYEVREPGRPSEPPTVSLAGRWSLTVNTPQGPQHSTAELAMAEDGTLSGTLSGSRGSASLSSGWVSGNTFSFTLSFSMGQRAVEATYTGTVEGERMSGTVSIGGRSNDFSGSRTGGPPRGGQEERGGER